MRIGDDVRIYDGQVIRLPRMTPEDRARADAIVAQYGGIVTVEPRDNGVAVTWSGLGEVTTRAETFASAIRQLTEQIRIHISQVA
jgi:hypothetical protein